MAILGWYRPHEAVNWTGEVYDVKTKKMVKEPSMTKQEFKDECDVNNIIKEFSVTGMAQHLSQRPELFEDLPQPFELQDALNMAAQAQASFMAVPAKIRAQFENDPVAFMAFVHDPANQQQLIEWGLAKERNWREPGPQKVEVVNQPSEKKPE